MLIGDSGGPVMVEMNNKAYVVGVTSHGEATCKAGVPNTSINMDTYKLRKDILELIDKCN